MSKSAICRGARGIPRPGTATDMWPVRNNSYGYEEKELSTFHRLLSNERTPRFVRWGNTAPEGGRDIAIGSSKVVARNGETNLEN